MSTHLFVKDTKNKKLVNLGNISIDSAIQDYIVWDEFMSLIDDLPEIDFSEIKVKDIDLKTLSYLISGYKILTGMTQIFCYFSGLVYCYNNNLELNKEKVEYIYEYSNEYEKLLNNKWEIL